MQPSFSCKIPEQLLNVFRELTLGIWYVAISLPDMRLICGTHKLFCQCCICPTSRQTQFECEGFMHVLDNRGNKLFQYMLRFATRIE